MQVAITLAGPAELHVVKNMFTAYFYDMSQYDDNLIINDHGLPMWAPTGEPGPRSHEECVRFNWWIRDACLPYITRVDGKPAGFLLLLTDRSHLAPEIDIELMDFYIAPKYRRQGIGRLAARAAFDSHHGTWQVFQLARNAPALAFWHTTITEYTGGQYESLDEGTQQRFRN